MADSRAIALAKEFDKAVDRHDETLKTLGEPPTTLQDIVEGLAVMQAGIYLMVNQEEPVTITVDGVAVTITKVSE